MTPDELPLKNVCVLIPTREGISTNTRNCLDDLIVLGARRVVVSGCADVALARNLLMTRALDLTTEETECFLLLDDDILFDRATAQLLVERALLANRAVSAVYCTNDGHIAARRLDDDRWLTGLGFMAVPRSLLQIFANALPRLKSAREQDLYAFCQSRMLENDKELGTVWLSEDQWFCHCLGGVVLAPLRVQHWKRVPLLPDDHTMAFLFGASEATTAPDNPNPAKAPT